MLALAATGAVALGLPAGRIAVPGEVVILVAEPPGHKKGGGAVQKRAPVIARPAIARPVQVRPQVQVKKFVPPVAVRKFNPPPIAVQKFNPPPVAMKKFGPPLAKGRPVARMPAQFVHVRSHRRHKHYGRVIGGVVLGSILAASAFYAYSSPPDDGLCWYWTNSDRERGYWDYCEAPDDDE